ncbi:hypothetical protein EDB89DRAFT_1911241 [Lactarius sanguifluus]|nr:hypothetical protein EDB89DRAFT_1911241 [Lactarius sanguifluus]
MCWVGWRGVAHRVGVAWGSVVAGALCVVLKGRGGSAVSCVLACHDGSWWGVGVAGLVHQRAVTGRWGLARRIGAMWWVGSGGVLGWWGVAGHGALRAVLGWCGGLAGCWGRDEWRWNGLQCPGSCVPCWGGVAGWQWRHVGAGSGLRAPGGGNDLQCSGAYVLITSEDGRGAWKGESGEARRGVEVGAQAGGLR